MSHSQKSKQSLYEPANDTHLLPPSDRSRLLYIIITRVKITELSHISSETLQKYPVIDDKETFIYWLQRNHLLHDFQPLHSNDRMSRKEKMVQVAFKGWLVPTEMVRNYYGDKVAIYFEWMNHYLKWLASAGLFGLVVTALNFMFKKDMNSPFNVYYSAFMVIWSICFVMFWKRRRMELNIKWDLFHNETTEEDMRKQFKGIPSINPITGRIEPTFGFARRLIRYL